jgi:hypothetical protein
LSEANDNKETDYDKLLWEWNLHEDELFFNRANFFLVAESMFFTAFAALVVASSSASLAIVLGLGGLGISILWLHIIFIQLHQTTKPLRDEMLKANEKHPFLTFYNTVAKNRTVKITSAITAIPILLAVMWAFLLIFYILFKIGTLPY